METLERVVELGANALLFIVNAYGLDALQTLRENRNITIPVVTYSVTSAGIHPGMVPQLVEDFGKNVSLTEAAQTSQPLKRAVEQWGLVAS